jgi:hypothetical protein
VIPRTTEGSDGDPSTSGGLKTAARVLTGRFNQQFARANPWDIFGFANTSATFAAIRQPPSEGRVVTRAGDPRRTKPLSPRAAILCVGMLNFLAWTAILELVLNLL